ncbi:hypothetical protein [Sandaracinus amylolyticus]|uniref:Lipoprotein n=1 Tax=Sandaracinus amylolyticus TaxID=927083 RepID=A0A0F6W8U9_9BACT|nr:hypothetical protein [Sandaracinus amylolyticus]AKF10296.1 hypothetical protein DB32_007445 [Sandaracinus amylolyticus]
MKTRWTYALAAALAVLSGCAGQSAEGAVAEALVSDERVPEAAWRAIDPIACGDAEDVAGYRRAAGADELVVGVDLRGRLRCIDTIAFEGPRVMSQPRTPVLLPRPRGVDPEPQPMLDWSRRWW